MSACNGGGGGGGGDAYSVPSVKPILIGSKERFCSLLLETKNFVSTFKSGLDSQVWMSVDKVDRG